MSRSSLKKDVEAFLDKYFTFQRVESPKAGYLALQGDISVIDDQQKFWGKFNVLVLVNVSVYPYTIPIVIEKSEVIDRDWAFHISKDGECCLDIKHRLILRRNRGIVLKTFYKEVIYPFFANYHFKQSTGSYANGEYEHFFLGIVQYYREEHGLEDFGHIIALLETVINGTKYEANRECPLCGGPKYKKCCRKIIYRLRPYGLDQLKEDLAFFKKNLK
ncbi:MAG: hypothetical protein AAFQ20_05535 [Bacteroidota bacterium]